MMAGLEDAPMINGNEKMLESDNDLFKSAIDTTENRNIVEEENEEDDDLDISNDNSSEINLNNVSEVLEKQLTVATNHVNNGVEPFIEITVTEANKIGDGMSAYVTYRVQTKTNIALFRRSSMSVFRRFSDFLGLHEKLVEKYLRSGRIIPPAPEKNAIATTRVKISGAPSDQANSSSEFVERRRASLERYLRRTAAHPVLRMDPDLREFLETDGDLPKATSTSVLSGAGVKRLFNKFGETVNKLSFKMEENEPWFDEKTGQLESIDAQLRKMHANVEVLVANRKELASWTSQFAKAAAMLSNCEEHTSLSRALSQLADVEEKIENVHNDQANSDFSILCELLKDYIALIGAVKEAFHERVKVYQHWQHSQMMLTKKREQKARFELTMRSDKVEMTNNEVIEWESKVERCEEEFQKISRIIKQEYEVFERNRIKEFKFVVTSYLESLMQHQEQVMNYWESFLPEAKAIN